MSNTYKKNKAGHDDKSNFVVGLSPRRVRKRLPVILGIVAVVVLTGCGVWYWMAVRSADNKTSAPAKQLAGKSLDQAVSEAYAKKDYAAAADLIESQENADEPAVQVKLALTYANQGEHKAALEVFDKLEKAGKLTSGYQAAAADVALKAKDKPTAIRYLKLASAKVKTEDTPVAESQSEEYALRAAELEKN